MKTIFLAALPAVALFAPAPAAAQLSDPAPGYSSLMRSDFATAEREIRASNLDSSDPARSINLGIALAKTGHRDEAAKMFHSVLMQDDVEMVVADGQTVMSHEIATRALDSLRNGVLSR